MFITTTMRMQSPPDQVSWLPVPTTRLLVAVGAVLMLSIVASVAVMTVAAAWQVWGVSVGLLLVIAIADALAVSQRARALGTLKVTRRVPHTLPVGVVSEESPTIAAMPPQFGSLIFIQCSAQRHRCRSRSRFRREGSHNFDIR
jgi:hypothetical protein